MSSPFLPGVVSPVELAALLVCVGFAWKHKLLLLVALFALSALIDVGVAVDALLLEPHDLQVRHVHQTSETVNARDDIAVRALSFDDCFNPNMHYAADPSKYVIMFGYGPDFALGDVHADLLVAGHTHGGQVQLPKLGPFITMSRVSREWGAGGTFAVWPGTTLVLTRGVGMERFFAPRLRFFCKPEVVIVDIVPG